MKGYIYQLKTWPHFTWDHLRLAEPLARVHHEQGRLLGRMEGLGFPLQQEALLLTLASRFPRPDSPLEKA